MRFEGSHPFMSPRQLRVTVKHGADRCRFPILPVTATASYSNRDVFLFRLRDRRPDAMNAFLGTTAQKQQTGQSYTRIGTVMRPAQLVVPHVAPPRLPQLGTQVPPRGTEFGGAHGVSV